MSERDRAEAARNWMPSVRHDVPDPSAAERERLSVRLNGVAISLADRARHEEMLGNDKVAASTAEGVVVKRYTKHGYFKGKIVKPGFIKALEEKEHWSKQAVQKNLLKEAATQS